MLQLDFGCDSPRSPGLTTVGPIHVVYQFGDPGYLPTIGYETYRRRDLPPQPCG